MDYYRLLGVDRAADSRAIRSAYRRLARRYHPDVAKGPVAARRFLVIREAYAMLSDPERREEYDRLIARSVRAPRFSGPRATTPDRGTDASVAPFAPLSGFRLVLDTLGILRIDVDVRVGSLSPDVMSGPRRSAARGRKRHQEEE